MFNTDRVLRWILIIEDYGPEIKYIQGKKNIVVESWSSLLINRNQKTTQDSTNVYEGMSKINGTK